MRAVAILPSNRSRNAITERARLVMPDVRLLAYRNARLRTTAVERVSQCVTDAIHDRRARTASIYCNACYQPPFNMQQNRR